MEDWSALLSPVMRRYNRLGYLVGFTKGSMNIRNAGQPSSRFNVSTEVAPVLIR